MFLRQLQKAVSGLLGPQDEEAGEGGGAAGNSIEYAYEDLAAATGDFSPQNRLGAGAAGAVFRGYLRGTGVAVKELVARQGQLNGFDDELRVLSRFRHPNLVTLLGWGQRAADAPVKYLVYELLPGGDVERRLRKARDGRQTFPWQHRLGVGIDAACGLSYMVNSQPKAFHRDIKPPNILLDANGTAKMADFGLAGTVKKPGRGHLTVSDISGTPGYADPHYIQSGKVTEASEVYSFGTVLLELLTNERPALCGPGGDIVYPMVQVVQPGAPGALERVAARVDPQAGWPRPLAEHFAQVALSCISGRQERRPQFEHLVETLRRLHAGAPAGPPAAPPHAPHAPHVPQPPAPGAGACSPPRGAQSPPCGARRELGAEAPGPAARGGSGTPPPCPGGPHRAAGCVAPPLAPAAAWPGPAGGPQRQPTELVLECIHADGVGLSQLAEGQRALSFPLDPARGRVVAPVGRQHQPDFFDALVPRRERLACISRTHFEIVWEPEISRTHFVLRKKSGNSLVLDGRELGPEEPAPLRDGACLRFSGIGGADAHFLSLRVRLQQRGNPTGAHALGATGPPARQVAAAVLECVHARGGAPPGAAPGAAPGARGIALRLEQPLDIGRQHQREFFDELLRAEPQWLTFISRTHCRVTLLRAGPVSAPGELLLQVENLSANVVLICGRQLARGHTDLIAEGGTLAFVAKAGGSPEETQFLRLELRRA